MAIREIVLNNFKWKVWALVLAILVWFIIQFAIGRGLSPDEQSLSSKFREEIFQRQIVLVLEDPNDTRTFELTPQTVNVTVRMPTGFLKKPVEKSIRVFVNLVDRPNVTEDVADVYAYAPPGIEVVKLEPRSVSLNRISPPP
jgi:hypothetical protein